MTVPPRNPVSVNSLAQERFLTESPGEFAKFLLLWIASRAKLVVLNDDLRLRQSPTSERRGSDSQEALVVPELRILMERLHDPAPAILRNQMKSIQLVDACTDGPVPDALCGHPSRDLREAQRSFIVRDGFPEHGFYLVQRSEEGGGSWAFARCWDRFHRHMTQMSLYILVPSAPVSEPVQKSMTTASPRALAKRGVPPGHAPDAGFCQFSDSGRQSFTGRRVASSNARSVPRAAPQVPPPPRARGGGVEGEAGRRGRAAVFWTPLRDLPPTHARRVVPTILGELNVPSFTYDDRLIWGFTYRILEELLVLVGLSA